MWCLQFCEYNHKLWIVHLREYWQHLHFEELFNFERHSEHWLFLKLKHSLCYHNVKCIINQFEAESKTVKKYHKLKVTWKDSWNTLETFKPYNGNTWRSLSLQQLYVAELWEISLGHQHQ